MGVTKIRTAIVVYDFNGNTHATLPAPLAQTKFKIQTSAGLPGDMKGAMKYLKTYLHWFNYCNGLFSPNCKWFKTLFLEFTDIELLT